MNKLYPIALALVLFASAQSCKKKDNLPDIITDTTAYRGIYQPGVVKSLEDVVMYANGGAITDTTFIKQFLARRSYAHYFDFSHDSASYSSDLRIYMEEGNGILFLSNGLLDTVRATVISETATEMTIGRNDTTIIQLTPFTETSCDSLYRLSMKAKPWRTIINNYPPPNGSEPGARMQTRYMIEGTNGSYTLPLLTIVTTSASADCQRLFNGIWNGVDAAALSSIVMGDTVVVQIGRVGLEKM